MDLHRPGQCQDTGYISESSGWRVEEWLIVDGYNMIGTWPPLRELEQTHLGAARDRLKALLTEYAAYHGQRVILVFDAYRVQSVETHEHAPHCSVVFTKADETADAYIERLVGKLQDPSRRLFVATSDYAEQRIAFGRGALRLSARELWQLVEDTQQAIARQVRDMKSGRTMLSHGLNGEVKRRLEKLRREQ